MNHTGDSSTDVDRALQFHTHMMGFSTYEMGWKVWVRIEHAWKKNTGAYEREAAEREAQREMEEKKAKMREILAAQDGKTLPKNWKEVMENSPWKADWVPEQKRSPPGIVVPEISKIAENEPKMNFKSNTFWWEAW